MAKEATCSKIEKILKDNVMLSKPFITLLQNPYIFNQEIINEINQGLYYPLNKRIEDLNNQYQQNILPRTENILSSISGGDSKSKKQWEVTTWGTVRKKIESIKGINNLITDEETFSALHNQKKRDNQEFVALFRLNNETIDTYRFKNLERIREKQVNYLLKYLDLLGGESERKKEVYCEFLLEAMGEISFWKNYAYFFEKYTKIDPKMAEGIKTISPDVFGRKRIQTSQEIADKQMKKTLKNYHYLNQNGLEVIPELIDDHRIERDTSRKRGGIHLSLVDSQGLYPIEIQYQGVTTLIKELF